MKKLEEVVEPPFTAVSQTVPPVVVIVLRYRGGDTIMPPLIMVLVVALHLTTVASIIMCALVQIFVPPSSYIRAYGSVPNNIVIWMDPGALGFWLMQLKI